MTARRDSVLNMRLRRSVSLFLAASIFLFGQRAKATRTPLPNLTHDFTSSLVESNATICDPATVDTWLIESVYPLGLGVTDHFYTVGRSQVLPV